MRTLRPDPILPESWHFRLQPEGHSARPPSPRSGLGRPCPTAAHPTPVTPPQANARCASETGSPLTPPPAGTPGGLRAPRALASASPVTAPPRPDARPAVPTRGGAPHSLSSACRALRARRLLGPYRLLACLGLLCPTGPGPAGGPETRPHNRRTRATLQGLPARVHAHTRRVAENVHPGTWLKWQRHVHTSNLQKRNSSGKNYAGAKKTRGPRGPRARLSAPARGREGARRPPRPVAGPEGAAGPAQARASAGAGAGEGGAPPRGAPQHRPHARGKESAPGDAPAALAEHPAPAPGAARSTSRLWGLTLRRGRTNVFSQDAVGP